jgi:hypothetical protein
VFVSAKYICGCDWAVPGSPWSAFKNGPKVAPLSRESVKKISVCDIPFLSSIQAKARLLLLVATTGFAWAEVFDSVS